MSSTASGRNEEDNEHHSTLQKTGWTTLLDPSEWDVLAYSTAFKLLLFPSYRSTDFEVHRNWLAITHSLPISEWYYDTTSEWTLDYPPFFAYFEKVLSIPAALIDPAIVDVTNLNYNAWSVVAYQRTTVILSELVLGAALLRLVRGAVDPRMQRIISFSLFLHPGFIIVDHIHFQYNGFMFGILLWSILMARNGNKLFSGILFAVLLNVKHIYMYFAPAYFIYLLRSFCFDSAGRVEIKNFLSLANSVIAIFVLSFGPFAVMGQIPQVLSRLFPFTRGLNHAYWAPNFWALLTALDRILLRLAVRTGAPVNVAGIASASRGLVGDTVFAVIPNVAPIHTFTITVAFLSVILTILWRNPSYKSFVTALTLCGYSSYLFGWHVHEKAVLLVLVPLSLLAAEHQEYFRTFLICSVSGIFSLFPLLFTPAESVIGVVYSFAWLLVVYQSISRRVYELPTSLYHVVLDMIERAYITGFCILQAFLVYWHLSSKSDQYEFLPLMLTSVYCAIGMVWGYIRLLYIYLNDVTYQGQLSEI